MHKTSYMEMEKFVEDYLDEDVQLKIIDIGSYDVNGTYKTLFNKKNWSYVGLDMGPGPNVDVVSADPYRYPFDDKTFDVVIAGSTIEHVEDVQKFVIECARILKDEGIMCMIGPWAFQEHRYQVDCWRILPDGMKFLIENIAGMKALSVYKNQTDCIGIAAKIYKDKVEKKRDDRISICTPVVRPQNMPKLIDRIHETCSGLDYEIVWEEDTERIGCPKMLKRLVDKSNYNLVCFIGDDTMPEGEWLNSALDDMKKLPGGWGVVGLNSQEAKYASHFLADKRILPYVGGEFFNTEYKHCWCECELTDIAKELGKFVFCEEAVLTHNHPIFGTAKVDDDYNRVYSKEYKKHDLGTYCRRKRERYGFKLGIGFPVIDSKVYLQFMTSFLTLNSPSYALLLPAFPVGEFPRDIAAVRNNIVDQALYEGCTHLLMMDTDQVYMDEETITKLLSHKKQVVSAPVHRRYPPFDNILLRGEVGNFLSIPEDEAYSGKLVQVDATGTGCILYDCSIFNEIPEPWFEFGIGKEGQPIGEDINFCMKLKEKGIPIFVDTSINIGHLSLFEVNQSTRTFFKALKGIK